jgi:UDP-2,3-diacylglucosamine pyrophosphatase LpxH
LTDHPFLTDLADWFYLSMQRIGRPLAANAKRSCKTFLRCVERVRQEAIAYAHSKNIDIVVCGHTHHAESFESEFPDQQPTYHNTGCWTDHQCHYWTVQDGLTQLHEIGTEKLAMLEIVS